MRKREDGPPDTIESSPTIDRMDRMETLDQETRVAGRLRGVRLPTASVHAMGFEQRYAREDQLGEGGMGVVALCHDKQIGRRVAVKTIQDDRAAHPIARKRFVREARIQGQLEHPSLVPVYDLGVDAGGMPFFTMRRVKGVTLEEIINGLLTNDPDTVEQWSRRRLLNAFERVCLAVDFCHRQGVLHRDIKPANIMFGDYGEVYLLDWGLAKVWAQQQAQAADIDAGEDPSARGAILGTPGYMSPEQIRGEEQLGPESDVFALGSVLFEILTLQELLPGGDAREVMDATLEPFESRPSIRVPDVDVPPELEAICVRATRRGAFERYQSARQLNDALEAYLEGQRDEELRHDMAASHSQNARDALQLASGDPNRALQHRKDAMREVGRALALDPDNEGALRTLMDILTRPPKRVPDEVNAGLADIESRRLRGTGLAAGIAYLTLFMYLPVFFWAGIENNLLIALFYLGALLSGLVCMAAWFSRRPGPNIPFTAMILSNITFAISASFFGPLVLMPAFVANNTAAYAFHFMDWRRHVSLACGVLAVGVPLLLEATGIISPSYSFSEAGMLVAPRAIGLGASPTLVFLSVGGFAAVLTGGILLARLRDNLQEVETKLYMYSWHLRQLLPEKRAA